MTNDTNDTKPEPETRPSQIEIGVDWDRMVVILQVSDKSIPALGIPLDVYVQSATSMMVQLLQRNAQAKSKHGIIVAHPGQLPGDLRKMN